MQPWDRAWSDVQVWGQPLLHGSCNLEIAAEQAAYHRQYFGAAVGGRDEQSWLHMLRSLLFLASRLKWSTLLDALHSGHVEADVSPLIHHPGHYVVPEPPVWLSAGLYRREKVQKHRTPQKPWRNPVSFVVQFPGMLPKHDQSSRIFRVLLPGTRICHVRIPAFQAFIMSSKPWHSVALAMLQRCPCHLCIVAHLCHCMHSSLLAQPA